ncbi:MAG TPA: hypothetical protein VIT92_06805 [Burkholderiaceae bacterium]
MKRLCFLLALTLLTGGTHAQDSVRGAGKAKPVRFAVLAHRFDENDEAALQEIVARVARRDNAFIVATGIKADREDCSDKLFQQRKAMLDAARDPVLVTLTADDWVACKNSKGKPAQIERLNRLRELLFPDSRSLGRQKIEVSRQAESAQFRDYAENAHWIVGDVLFATVNVPWPNNNYRPDAGRNSEYEDRHVANREWLQRVFRLARSKKLAGVVLFSDADLYTAPTKRRLRDVFTGGGLRDGLQDLRRYLDKGVQQFGGRVLLIDRRTAPDPYAVGPQQNLAGDRAAVKRGIEWRGKLGHVSLAAQPSDTAWIALRADSTLPALFLLEEGGKVETEKKADESEAGAR